MYCVRVGLCAQMWQIMVFQIEVEYRKRFPFDSLFGLALAHDTNDSASQPASQLAIK